MPDRKLTLIEHLGELRARIIKSIIFLIICSCVAYNYIDIILLGLVKPVGRLVFIAPEEAFIANIKIAFLCGLFLSSPFILYQIWQFISVGFKTEERRYILIFGQLSFILFILGCLLGYFFIVPVGIKLLLGFSSDFVYPMISISRYVSFVGTLTFVFGLIFQLPLAMLFLTKINVVTPAFFSKRRRHAIVLIFIIAAALTPPDVITQILMALPLLVLYELGIFFSKLTYRFRY